MVLLAHYRRTYSLSISIAAKQTCFSRILIWRHPRRVSWNITAVFRPPDL